MSRLGLPMTPAKMVGTTACALTPRLVGVWVTLNLVTFTPLSGRKALSKIARATWERSLRSESSALLPAASAAPSTADWRSASVRVLREYSSVMPTTARSGTSAKAKRIATAPRSFRTKRVSMG
jgi:hypothetical protein